MECPHCNKEIPGESCPECDTIVPSTSRFCMECGASLDFQSPEPVDDDDAYSDAFSDAYSDAFSLENRVLCPDGTCTGIILNGKCTECGKKHPGKRK